MPVTLQLAGLKYRNENGEFQSADCLKGDPGDTSIVAPDYADLVYPVSKDSLCTHDGDLFKAKQNINASETWTAAHWDQTTIENELKLKADKVSNATENNFAALDANGNLKDSGHKHSDYLTQHQDISGKVNTSDFYATNMPISSSDTTKVSEEITRLSGAIDGKADEPTGTKAAGKVYGLNSSLEPVWVDQQGGGGGTSDYADLTNKPQINGVTLSGNKTSADLSIPTTADIETAVDDWLEENITNPDSPPLDRSLSSNASAAPADMVGNLSDTLDAMPNRAKYDLSSITPSTYYNGMSLSGDGGYVFDAGWKIEDYVVNGLDVIYLKLKQTQRANYEFHNSNSLSSATLVGSTYNAYVNDVISIPETATHLFICFNTDEDYREVKKATSWVDGINKRIDNEIEEIQQINDDIRINYKQGDSIPIENSTNNYALDGVGGYKSKTGCVLYQYFVTANEYIYIDVNEYEDCGAFEFHTTGGAITTGNLVGEPSLTGYDGYIKVPTGAGRIAITGTASDIPTVKKATRSSGIDELFADVNELSKEYETIMYDLSDIDVAQTWNGMKLNGSGGWSWDAGYGIKRYLLTGVSNLYLILKKCLNANYEFHSNGTLSSSSLIGTPYNVEVDGFVSIPENATNLFINYSNDDNSYQVKSATNWRNEIEEQIEDLYTSSGNGSAFASANSITASTMTVCQDFHLKKGFTIDFYGEFSTFANVEIGQGISAAQGRSIRITSTAIELYFGGGNGTTEKVLRKTENHGLTLADYIYVKIDVDRKSSIKVTLMSDGETVTKDMGSATGGSGNCEIYVSGTMTSAKGSLMATDAFSDVFIFGDSYVNPFATSYTKHLLMNGYTKFLLSGIPGGTGQYEINGFRTAVSLHKPKVALWALGMNDAGASAWKTYADQFVDICESKGITPVLATIPNVANKKDNTALNEYVRESGHRYVDFAKAVGAENSDSTWYDGMLINNDIHPTDLGGIALMNMLFVDLPEIANAYDPNDVTE